MGELGAAGAVGFSDDGRPLPTAALTRRALQYVKVSRRFVAIHAQDDSLFKGGQMHEGPASARLGLTGIPSLCESLDVSRTLDIAAYEDAALHVCHVSTAASLEAIARAKAAGVRVTAEATPHHLTLNDERVAALDPNLKMNPPLRAESDRKALVAALRSGLVDCVATDHAPHVSEEKDVPFEEAPFGCIGLETAFSVLYAELVASGELDLATLVTRMSSAPARIAGLEAPSLAAGAHRRPLRRRPGGRLDGHAGGAAVALLELALARPGAHRQGPAHRGRRPRRLGRPCLVRPSSSSRTAPPSPARRSPARARWAARSSSTPA